MSEMRGVNCSIVIRAFNEERHIGRLLDGISHQTVHSPEIILVDSGSTDRTAAIAASHGAKILHIHPEEFSFGRSLNLGISAAQNEMLVIASAHVYPVYPDWLEKLLAPFADPKVALSYGKQRGGHSTQFSEHQIFERWFPNNSVLRQPHPFCNNANAAIRRNLWLQHPYDETLTGLEDLSWARWAMDQGYAIAYVSEAEVVHLHNETPRGVYNRYRREAMAYKHLFPAEKFGLGEFLRLLGVNILTDSQQAARQRSLRKNLPSIFWFRLMQFWGTYQGYRRPGPVTEQLRRTFYYPQEMGENSAISPREVEPIRYGEP
jgi:glycosyltransferase involved in cell wall biosynthesis